MNGKGPEINHVYFVSYSYVNDQGFGFGCVDMHLSGGPITSIEQTKAIQECLQNKYPNLRNVAVLNFILLRTEEVEAS